MPSKCCMVNCSSRAERDAGIKFFRFPIIPSKFTKLKPLTEERQRAGLKVINRKDLKNKSFKHSMVCSKHFVLGISAKLQDVLNPDWIPSIQLGYGSNATIDCSRYERTKNRIARKEQIAHHISNIIPDVSNVIPENLHESDMSLVQEKVCPTEDLPLTHLAFQYNVSTKTVSNLFHKAIVVIHNKLSCFVFWPDKEASTNNAAKIFKQLFGANPIFIIDCFEIFCERSGNHLARSNTFSAYKHHQTLKYLICISSFGLISFISKGYGGRCSDKFIFESCGILNFITEGDIILVDQGFLIERSISAKKARLIMPSFKTGRSQLEPMSIENNRNISSVRIHVERVIGVLRQKFLITTNRQPITSISKKINENMNYDYIMTISCAVFNLNQTILSGAAK